MYNIFLSYVPNKSFKFIPITKEELISYYGVSVPTSLPNQDSIFMFQTGFYLLTNTEFQYDSLISGFEMYAKSSGAIKLFVNFLKFFLLLL